MQAVTLAKSLYTQEITGFSRALTKHLFTNEVANRSIRFLAFGYEVAAPSDAKEQPCMARNRIDVHTHLLPSFDMSRRNVLVGGAAMVAAFGLPMRLLADRPSPASAPAPHGNNQGGSHMNMITTKDGTQIYYKDWGTRQPVVFSHGWPLSADAFESQVFFLASRGYRCIA